MALPSTSARTASRLLGAFAVAVTGVAATALLAYFGFGDVFVVGWVLFGVGVGLVGGVAAWTNRTPILWVAALLLTGLSVLGMWSIGFLFAPAALGLFVAAILAQRDGPRTEVRESILAEPPTVPEAVLKTLAGAGSLVVGGTLVYLGSIRRELFGACASETLACVVATTHWDAVVTTVVGLGGLALGGWLVWKQVYVARVIASGSVE